MTTPDKRNEHLAITFAALVLLCACAAAVMLLFGGCAADGTVDYAAINSVARTGMETYDHYQNPSRYPVYPVQPVAPVQPYYPPVY